MENEHKDSQASPVAQPWKQWFKPESRTAEPQQRQFVVNARGCQNTKRSEYLLNTGVKRPEEATGHSDPA
ncbi:hypothetical protein PVAG01_09325 [Phlyctema vagabunda]|uniref:Uncharacterized protein n=1 Tax=Phlyctema vagabunda TaxID=108571 RepID=A0ABR4P720_9HELO